MTYKIFNFQFSIFNSQKGQTVILISFFILMIILLVTLSAAAIMAMEIRMSGEIANSIPAFYGADAGAERCLYQARMGVAGDPCFEISTSITSTLSNGATFTATRTAANEIDSNGKFFVTSRSIQLWWP